MASQPREAGSMEEGDGSWRAVAPAPTRPVASPRGRIAPADLLAFRRDLDASTRRAVVTPVIVAACAAYFAAMAAAGVPVLWPSAAQLTDWGANDGARLILRHEYGRLVASVFVHGGLIHLAVNMWSLLVIGPLVERIYGHLAFAVLYLAAGVGGAIASAAVPPVRVSVGASGAICGVLGGLLAFLFVHRRAIPPTVLRQLGKNALGVVVFMAALGVAVTNIDQAAHLGGLATGFVCGLLLIGPWPVRPGSRRRTPAVRAALAAAIAAGLAGAAVVVADRADAIVPPARRLDDFSERVAPIVGEFNAIRMELARSIGPDARVINPSEGGTGLDALRAVRSRSAANAARLEGLRDTGPELRPIRESLSRMLAGQVARVDALARYAETGDRSALAAARDASGGIARSARDCESERLRYLTRHGLIPPG